ncbi:phospholipase A-2-activating protein [Massariosphaeria phaeospora]|uniref:Phospholipase A-2-activating protein n=1 Tax=Massariosphaeria phaeospora TaxID=100035 RepID=A0A7C8M4J0_9PLEO|nr:phospholipase A-2-activating protein [Massariosphaeria phaeospora]
MDVCVAVNRGLRVVSKAAGFFSAAFTAHVESPSLLLRTFHKIPKVAPRESKGMRMRMRFGTFDYAPSDTGGFEVATPGTNVRSVAFPHPTTVVSASRDHTVRLWKLQTSEPPSFDCTIKSHGKEFVNSLAIVPPSSLYPEGLIASSGKDQIIDVRQPDKSLDDNAEALLIGHGNNVCALDASADGKLVISGSWDYSARVWEVGKWSESTELSGHEASVWAVLAYDGATIITGCADKKIRIFRPTGALVRTIQTGDVVRALCRLPANHPSGAHFASAGNDAIIRLWNLDGRQIYELHGHENFIYSLAALPDGRLVSSGEDRTARIWENQQCVQTITHPAISVWTVAASENGDIVTGASDRIVRIFTRATERYADPAAITQFSDEVSSSSIPQQAVGDVNKEQLPGPEFLTQKSGTKEGQVQMIKETNGNVSAYQWSSAANQWVMIGTVVDQAGSSGRKISFNGKEYDYVFDVDIEDGKPPLKLPYNLSQNPYEVARKFCEDNKLPLTYLDQVTNFIVQNTQGATMGQAPSQSTDVWGTGSRYRPGDAAPAAADAPQQPPTPKSKVLPQKTYLDIMTANHKVILKKLQEFNQQLVNDGQKALSFNPSDIDQITATVTSLEKGDSKSIDSAGVDLIVKAATTWPTEKRLPGLDLLRLLFASDETVAYLTQEQNIIHALGDSGVFSDSSAPNNTMMAIRSLSNLFKSESGRTAANAEFDTIHAFISPFLQASARNLIIAITTIYINYSVLLSLDVNADRVLTLLNDLAKILSKVADSEAVYRALVATGTLLCLGRDFCEAGRDILQIQSVTQQAAERVREPRVKNVVAEIQEKLQE